MTKDINFDFPKAELHCHLDGCYRLSSIVEMAKTRGVKLPSYDPVMLKLDVSVLKRTSKLDDYLNVFHVINPTFSGHREHIARITLEAVEDKAKEGVKYIEFRFSPHLLTTDDVTAHDVVTIVVDSMTSAMEKWEGDEIVVRTILCAIVEHPEWSMEVAELCKEFKQRGVVGIDIAGVGDVNGELILKHKPAFEFCKKNGIHRTVHAGEKGNAQEVKRAVEELYAQRIGHGYNVLQDDEIYAYCKRKNIHFEVCPLSSYLTASVDVDMTLHPAITFMKDGASFSLNSDDPGVQQTTLVTDYEVARNSFGFSLQQIQQLNINALQASFLEEPKKSELIEKFKKAYSEYNLAANVTDKVEITNGNN